MKKINVLLILFMISCTNQEVNGPDVMLKAKAEDRFKKIYSLQLGKIEGSLSGFIYYEFYVDQEPHNYCVHRSYYWTKSVNFCEELLLRIDVKNTNDLDLQTAFTKEFLCDLEEVKVLNDKKPLQGEVDNCSKWSQPYYNLVY